MDLPAWELCMFAWFVFFGGGAEVCNSHRVFSECMSKKCEYKFCDNVLKALIM